MKLPTFPRIKTKLEIKPEYNPLVIITVSPTENVHTPKVFGVFRYTDLHSDGIMIGNGEVREDYVGNPHTVHKTPLVSNAPVF
jgi:hypothetical protein